VTKARSALWPMILGTKLVQGAATTLVESDFAEERHHATAAQTVVMPGCRCLQELGRAAPDAVRKAWKTARHPATWLFWRYGSCTLVDIEHPLPLTAYHWRIAGTGPQPLSRHHHRQAGWPRLRPLAALHHGLEQHRRSTEDLSWARAVTYSPYFSDQWNEPTTADDVLRCPSLRQP